MKNLSFYIVFHDKLYKENTNSFTPESLKRFVKWVAVNEKIPKTIPDWIPEECILKEWEMKIHSPLYQMLNFYQNSAFLHLFWNKEYKNSKYIGFGQYDMSIDAKGFEELDKVLTKTDDTICGSFIFHFSYLFDPFDREFWKNNFLNPYNTHFNTEHTLEKLETMPLFLLHTFIMPSWFFSHIMDFVELNLPQILRGLKWETRHLAGTLERVFALCISCGVLEGKLKNVLGLTNIKNVDNQRLQDSFRGL
jgi:hypothetical protein